MDCDQPPTTAGGSDFFCCRERAGQVRRLNEPMNVNATGAAPRQSPIRVVSLLLLLLFAAACERQIARTRQPLKPPEEQTEVRGLPANSSPKLKLVIDGAIDQIG